MIILTEFSTRATPSDFISDGEGVWRYSFGGDETYIDDLGVEFYWSGRKQVFDIRGVVRGIVNYTEVLSVADCQNTPESFYWDDENKRIYVHHADNENDYAIGRATYRVVEATAGFATGRFPGQLSYYPELYFDPVLLSIGTLTKRVDPLKFGLLSFESSTYDLASADGGFDDFSLASALNSQVRFVLMAEGQADIDDGVRLFTGYTGGARRDDERIGVQLSEARTFYNRAICPNRFTTDDYALLADDFVGKNIPVAYGEIRRGIMVPVDTAAFDKAVGGNVTFVLADPNLYSIRAVDTIYDSDDNVIDAAPSVNADNEVVVSIPADADLDLKEFRWKGEGFDIAGTFDNGLDIMKAIFGDQAELSYLASTFDTTQWGAQTAANTQSIGLSVQSEDGLIEAAVEPITVSLQGIVEVLGDGRLTFIPRDPSGDVARFIRQDELLEEPDIEIVTDEVVSTVTVEYARNFVADSGLFARYTAEQAEVAATYGIDSSQPLSPVRTVLAEKTDAEAVGEEVASTSSEPQTIISASILLDENPSQLFDIVQINVGRYDEVEWRVTEVLERGLTLRDGELVVDLVLRELPDRTPIDPESVTFDEGTYSETPELTINEGEYADLASGYETEGVYS
jgi:hypothetical protein